jgi:LysM repeat protein
MRELLLLLGKRWGVSKAICCAVMALFLGAPASGQTAHHLVLPKQTWYGIARQHNVSVDALQSLNPDVVANGLQPGDSLRLPQPATLPDIPALVAFEPAEPLDTTPAARPVLTAADTLKILAILPFQFDADTIEGGIEDPRVVRLRQIALECYQGMRWAAHELSQSGMDVALRVVDAEPDSLGQIWSLADVLWADVVLGPLRRNALDSAMDVSALLGKPHWALISNGDALVSKGPHVHVAAPTESAAAALLGATAARLHPGEQVTMLANGIYDADLEEAFSQGFAAARDSGDVPLAKLKVTSRFAEGIAERLGTTQTHVLAVPAGKSCRAMVAHLQNELLKADSIQTRLFIHPDAREYDFLERRLMDHVRLVMPATDHVNWEDSLVYERLRPYRDLTATDPSNYALIAHDAVLESASWCDDFPYPVPAPLARQFDWAIAGPGMGWINEAWRMQRYNNGWWEDLDAVTEPSGP